MYYDLVHSPKHYLLYNDMEDKYGKKVMKNIALVKALYLITGRAHFERHGKAKARVGLGRELPFVFCRHEEVLVDEEADEG